MQVLRGEDGERYPALARSPRSKGLLLPVALGLAVASGSCATEFCVSPVGNDAWTGSSRKPYRTLERARDAIRELKQQAGGLKQLVTLYLRQGTRSCRRLPVSVDRAERETSGLGATLRYSRHPRGD